MDFSNVQRASSAGYRLPERRDRTEPATAEPQRTRRAHEKVSAELKPNRGDPVKQDEAWKDFVRSEKRGVKEWEKNWGFLWNYDQMGQLKPDVPLPGNVPFSSDHVPITSNRMYGSRLSTLQGTELVRLERLCSGSHHKHKQDPEMLTC